MRNKELRIFIGLGFFLGVALQPLLSVASVCDKTLKKSADLKNKISYGKIWTQAEALPATTVEVYGREQEVYQVPGEPDVFVVLIKDAPKKGKPPEEQDLQPHIYLVRAKTDPQRNRYSTVTEIEPGSGLGLRLRAGDLIRLRMGLSGNRADIGPERHREVLRALKWAARRSWITGIEDPGFFIDAKRDERVPTRIRPILSRGVQIGILALLAGAYPYKFKYGHHQSATMGSVGWTASPVAVLSDHEWEKVQKNPFQDLVRIVMLVEKGGDLSKDPHIESGVTRRVLSTGSALKLFSLSLHPNSPAPIPAAKSLQLWQYPSFNRRLATLEEFAKDTQGIDALVKELAKERFEWNESHEWKAGSVLGVPDFRVSDRLLGMIFKSESEWDSKTTHNTPADFYIAFLMSEAVKKAQTPEQINAWLRMLREPRTEVLVHGFDGTDRIEKETEVPLHQSAFYNKEVFPYVSGNCFSWENVMARFGVDHNFLLDHHYYNEDELRDMVRLIENMFMHAAIPQLGDKPNLKPETIQVLLEEYKAQFSKLRAESSDYWIQLFLASTLSKHHVKKAIPFMAKTLERMKASKQLPMLWERESFAYSLDKMNDPSVVPILIAMIEMPEPRFLNRYQAITYLLPYAKDATSELEKEMKACDTDLQIAQTLSDLKKASSSPEAANKFYREGLESFNRDEQYAAFVGLAHLQRRENLGLLLKILEDGDPVGEAGAYLSYEVNSLAEINPALSKSLNAERIRILDQMWNLNASTPTLTPIYTNRKKIWKDYVEELQKQFGIPDDKSAQEK